MLGAENELLYFGKARNLRARLRSYARIKPGEDERLVPLLAAVREVRWERCPTEADALRRETELIRALRPPFNITHAQLSEHLAIAIRERGHRCRVRLASEPAPDPERMWFYPFVAATPSGMAALTRLLFMAQPGSTHRDAPAGLTRSSGCELKIDAGLRAQLFSFLDGRSPRLLRSLDATLRVEGGADPVRRRSIARDLNLLLTFYRTGPRAAATTRSGGRA
ncbi:MAG TPA: nucleotide excision repair endonuclease [Candidatus Dormibacteraeota bacterium]|nr:nucleotide excision repair endonuclease [Candidatus Dormibacteraeota bacterium]